MSLSNDFLDMIPEAKQVKKKKLDFIKICASKTISRKTIHKIGKKICKQYI